LKNDSTFLYGGHVRANGIRQHYLRYGGKGAPLVLIPGITSPAITWGFVGERLGRTYDTYVLDVRGRGLSETGPDLAYDLDTYAKDAIDFARILNLAPYRLVGHSMGARIAARIAPMEGERLARVALIDPPLSGPGRRPYVKTLSFYLDAIHEAREGRADVEAIRRTYPGWNEQQLRLRAEWLHTCDDTAIAQSLLGINEEDIHGDLPRIRVPAMLMVAGKGGVILDDEAAEAKRLLPSLVVKKIEGAGHMIPFDDFDGFFALLDPFLAG
jgi:N-formylmaleamate deformylase